MTRYLIAVTQARPQGIAHAALALVI